MTSSRWDHLLQVLGRQRVVDVWVPGWIDRDDAVPEFRPQPVVVFLALEEGVLRLASVGQYDQLAVTVEKEVSLDGIELFDEAEDELALASQGEGMFGDGWQGLRCTRIRSYADGGSSPDRAVVKCLALELESRYWVFFDPTWAFGVRIGNAEDLRVWERDFGAGGGGTWITDEPRPVEK